MCAARVARASHTQVGGTYGGPKGGQTRHEMAEARKQEEAGSEERSK